MSLAGWQYALPALCSGGSWHEAAQAPRSSVHGPFIPPCPAAHSPPPLPSSSPLPQEPAGKRGLVILSCALCRPALSSRSKLPCLPGLRAGFHRLLMCSRFAVLPLPRLPCPLQISDTKHPKADVEKMMAGQ